MTRARDLASQADLTFDGNTLKIDTVNDRIGIGTASPQVVYIIQMALMQVVPNVVEKHNL